MSFLMTSWSDTYEYRLVDDDELLYILTRKREGDGEHIEHIIMGVLRERGMRRPPILYKHVSRNRTERFLGCAIVGRTDIKISFDARCASSQGYGNI